MQQASRRAWWPVLIAVFLGLGLLAFAQSKHPFDPPEDAYITFRYARNLANGYGLVWNPGEDPVEGSTEFIWTVMLAGMVRLGFGMEQAALVLNLAFGAAAVVVVTLAAYALSGRRLLPSIFAGGSFAAGPLAYHVRGGFATPLFTLLLVIVFVASILLTRLSQEHRLYRMAYPLLALGGLFLGLTRPEGVLYFGLTWVALLVLLKPAQRLRLLRYTLLLFVLPGLVYFVWRWRYFGYLLPNTFYVKSTGGLLHLRYFEDIYLLFRFLAPLILLIGVGLLWRARRDAWQHLILLAPAFVFPWFYLLIDQLQNLGKRFQYPVYPLFLLAGAVTLGILLPDEAIRPKRVRIRQGLVVLAGTGMVIYALFVVLERVVLIESLVLGLLLLAWLIRDAEPDLRIHLETASLLVMAALAVFTIQAGYRLARTFYPTRYDDLQAVGKALQPFADRGYTLVASEAGWLPYFSEWRTIDPFGLNNEYIAHNGLNSHYLRSVEPDVILFHEVPNPDPPRWRELVRLLRSYAEENGFALAAVIERKGPRDVHVYYVRRDNPEAQAIIDAITGLDGFVYQYRAP
ncbi:MAG: hypothetical protein D6775_15955 [Caldilineae bacterium]|nr:MAG: hypothetical protein D6775_15955 [Caldilineae bacterium]